MCLAKNIRYLRKKHNLSQDDVANLLGYKSYTTIQKWEMGVSEPPIGKLRALASRFGVDIDILATVDIEKAELQEHLSSDPLRNYYDQLIQFLDSSPEYRQLVSDAVHVRPEDIDFASQCLKRLADPESSAPDLPDSARSGLTAEALALVRDTPEVLAAEAEYIKSRSKQQSKPERSASTSTGGVNRKSG